MVGDVPQPLGVITSSSAYPVHPGDQMTAWVVSNPSGTSFYLSEKDTTAGWTFSTTQTASGFARSSAEVVAEAPSSCSLLFCSEVPLSNFGQVSFSGADVIDNSGNNGPLSSYAANQITMSSNGKTLAVPSNLSSDGRSFSITWQNFCMGPAAVPSRLSPNRQSVLTASAPRLAGSQYPGRRTVPGPAS